MFTASIVKTQVHRLVYRHKRRSVLFLPSSTSLFYKTHFFHYQRKIETELDFLFGCGKLFIQQLEDSSQCLQRKQSCSQTIKGRSISREQSASPTGVVIDWISDRVEVAVDESREEESSKPKGRQFPSVTAFYFFQNSAFDLDRFIVLSNLSFPIRTVFNTHGSLS